MSVIDNIKEKLIAGWQTLTVKSDEDRIADVGRERFIVFFVALVLAFFLWLMVNLSREFNLTVDLPITLAGMPEDRALVENLPSHAKANVSAEGWKLINLYNNPPVINIDVRDKEVNLYDQVQKQMNSLPEISVQKVQPLILTVELEERISKKVPVKSRIATQFDNQYDFVEPPVITPDSITLNGARSLVSDIEMWQTDSITIDDISSDISKLIELEEPGNLISLSQYEVRYEGKVAQFTEGEVQVKVSSRGMPSGQQISFSPSMVTVKYDVPLDEYSTVQQQHSFEAYVTYSQVLNNPSGFVSPQISFTESNNHIKISSITPRSVAYFKKLDTGQ
ncbi:hypothetical protein LX73_1832 [Fodinibius salinus]|uniref:YbbR-like protein n=1 Tax=Fodinibius salinus TaxID=860790 RepID=A0A5D3YN07_9BACT|nr:hypothetical protein [Fodinibius salinus]TYP94107.1 hypothetical protein LX73_1832 [Fodinibius salinus]